MLNKIKKSKIIISKILIISIIFSLIGCTGRKELNNLGIINLMGIDLTENGKYKITTHIIKPSTGQGGQPSDAPGPGSSIWVGEATGHTVQEAIKNIRAKTSWLLIWSHCDIYILGNSLCKNGIGEVIDYLARSQEIRLTSNIMTSKQDAWQILRHSPEEKKEPVADQIDGLISNIQDWSMSANLNLKEVMARLASGKQELVLGQLELIPADPVKKGQQNPAGKSNPGDESLNWVLQMAGSSVFKKDKLAGNLTPEETRGYLRLINEIKLFNMNIKAPEKNKLISLETYNSKTDIKMKPIEDTYKVLIKIKEKSRLSEQYSKLDLFSKELIDKIEKKKEKAIREETQAILDKMKVLKSDFLGLRSFLKKEPKNWYHVFPQLTYEIKVESNFNQVGKIHKSIMK